MRDFEPVTTADCHMFQEGIENAERVTCYAVENAYADGAYCHCMWMNLRRIMIFGISAGNRSEWPHNAI